LVSQQTEFVIEDFTVFEVAEGVEPVRGACSIPVTINLKELNISPTFVLGVEETLTGVSYFLRLHLYDASGREYWNTHQVCIYRTNVAGIIPSIENNM
jgi:hypothetical protein